MELSSYLSASRSHDMEEVFINQEPRLYNSKLKLQSHTY